MATHTVLFFLSSLGRKEMAALGADSAALCARVPCLFITFSLKFSIEAD